MAKLHHKVTTPRSAEAIAAQSPDEMLATIQSFLSCCRTPAVLESGEDVLPLAAGEYAIEVRSGKLWIEVWTETRSISRRILGIERHATGVLDCTVQRFGGNTGRLTLLDRDRPQAAHRSIRGARESFAAQFRRMLSRHFPAWEISFVSCSPDLQRSFSGVFPRAVARRGNQRLAAFACSTPETEAEMLSFALIWHNYVCMRAEPGTRVDLCIFLPEGCGKLTAHRLRWLTGQPLVSRLFLFNAHGSAGEVDSQDLGNVETRVAAQYLPPHLSGTQSALLAQLSELPGIGCSPELNGAISIRFKGLEFARLEPGRIILGIQEKREIGASHTEEVVDFATQLAALSPASNRRHGTGAPETFAERWLESAVRSNLPLVDPSLIADPVHGQVLTLAGGDRDLIDLLAINSHGRLCVLELKAAEDIHLPLQALDYWMHVAWHARRGALNHLFPFASISAQPPKLLLVAPALSFHPSNVAVLRYFSREIDVERVGVNSEWQKSFKVVLRLTGAETPQSQTGALHEP